MNHIEKVATIKMLTAMRKEKNKQYKRIMKLEEELVEAKCIYSQMQKLCDEMQENMKD